MVVSKKDKKIVCTNFCNGKKHDFKLLKDSKVKCNKKIKVIVDSGYQGLQATHENTTLPRKKKKKQQLGKEEKLYNKRLASDRVLNENVIGMIKRFKTIADKYRNRRKRFGLRFNLIAGIYNMEL